MPAYYDIITSVTTNSAAGTISSAPHLRMLTGTAVSAALKGIYAGARSSTAGGGLIKVFTAGTAMSSMGTGYTPTKRNPGQAAAVTSAATATTCTGATSTLRMSVGFAQTGGMGGWVAIEPDAAILLQPGGSAGGNVEFGSIANSASVLADLSVEFSEQ